MSNKHVCHLDAYVSTLGDEMAHLFLLSWRSTAKIVEVLNRQSKKLVIGSRCFNAQDKKWTILQEGNLIFSNSVFGEVLKTLPWLRESFNVAAQEKPKVFVMGVNILDFNPLPSSPLAQRSEVKSKQEPLPDFSMSHCCVCCGC